MQQLNYGRNAVIYSKKNVKTAVLLIWIQKSISSITSHGAGYIDKDLETIVGLQTDAPLKRSMQPFGGIRMAEGACKSYGYEVDPEVSEIFTKYRKNSQSGCI